MANAYHREPRYHASTWRRLAAFLIDILVLMAVLAPLVLLLDAAEALPSLEAGLSGISTAYFMLFWSRGATPGMRALDLRLVDASFANPTLRTVLVRYLAWVALQFLLLLPVFWILFIVYRLRKQPLWHDTVAKTYVLRTADVSALAAAPIDTPTTLLPAAGSPAADGATVAGVDWQVPQLTVAPASAPLERCANCGSPRDAASVRFCRRCGSAMPERQPSGTDTSALEVKRRSPLLMGALSAVTLNLGGLIWFARTWAELRQVRRDGRMDVHLRPMRSTRRGTALEPCSRSMSAVLLVLFLSLAAACGSDAAYSVETHNAADVSVVLLMTGVTTLKPELPPERYRLEPGQTRSFDWRAPAGNEPPATVRAESVDGTLIFCRRFTYAEIQQASFRIEIVPGDLRCGP